MHGLLEWVDLTAPDLALASVFYSELFGWECAAEGGASDYLRCRKDGRLAAGIALAADSPAAWHSYVTVDSVDEVTARAAELAATVAVEPRDLAPAGRMAYVVDPQGAGLGF